MDICDALEGHGIPFRKSGKPGEIWLNCPFCTERNETQDERFRLGVNVETGQANCFNCGWKTRDIVYLAHELNRALNTDMFERGQVVKKKPVPVHLPEGFAVVQKAGNNYDYWNNAAWKYLRMRNVTFQQIKDKHIGYTIIGEMKFRIVVPVYYEGKLKGLVGRDFTGKQEPKYKNSSGEKVVYNVPRNKAEGAVLVEGVFDSFAVERGCSNGHSVRELDSLAVLGHSLTDRQLEQLWGYKKFILWPDPDGPGVFGFLGMVPELQRITKDIYLVVPKMKGGEDYDPSEMFPPEVKDRLRSAKPYTPELEQKLRAWLAFKEDE